jgi:hypothetical protein
MKQWIERGREYSHTYRPKENKHSFKGKSKKLLAPIMVNQYNKQCVVKREDINSGKERF